jgi:hypothetical protein
VLRAEDSLSLKDRIVLNLLRITLGLKGKRPVALKASRIVVSLKEDYQAR